MRVYDPRVRQQKRQRRGFPKKRLLLFIAAVLIGGVIALFIDETSRAPSPSETPSQNISTPQKSGKLKNFTAQEFRDLYNNFAYPNTAPISEDTPITGFLRSDERIRALALQRGYKLRSAPVTNTFTDIGDGFRLQQRAAQPWLDMKAEAAKAGLNFGVTDAYRAADDQKEIFLARLRATGVPLNGLGSGAYDGQINQVLAITAPPGYSRHHSGYTVDITCQNQPNLAFENTVCFQWLEANNYERAKTYGWIPSYPAGTSQQGPEPESWEYVWVGVDAVTE